MRIISIGETIMAPRAPHTPPEKIKLHHSFRFSLSNYFFKKLLDEYYIPFKLKINYLGLFIINNLNI
jgi:hypothetical protein